MTDRRGDAWLPGPSWPSVWLSASVLLGAILVFGGDLAALPMKDIPPASSRLLIEDGPAASPSAQDDQSSAADAPLAELNQALAAARTKLLQLNQAAEALAGAATLRDELSALEEANRRLVAELQTLRASRDELQRADHAARARIAELEQTLDETTAESKQLDGDLAAVRWQNAQLTTSLARARTVQEDAVAETESVRTELSARVVELQETAERASGETRRLREQLAATAERLNDANTTLTEAEQERDMVLGQLDAREADVERLSGELEVAEAELRQAGAANRGLETRLAGLELAASAATDAARQNLLAVENQIAALSSTLATVDLAPAENGGVAEALDDAEKIDGAGEISGAARPPADDPDQAAAPAPAAGPPQGSEPSDSQLALVKLSDPAGGERAKPLAELTALLPTESRIQAQSLLADLEALTDAQGLKMIVPGEQLFATNSEEVRDTAHESLAKVAELINLYKSQPVLIVGHTDALGMADYNKTLSERRASLVKQFFVDNFDVDADRVATQGMGEQRPIATNATAAGRRANRRVEVLILN